MGWREEDKIYTEEEMAAVRKENRILREIIRNNREKYETISGLTDRESDLLYNLISLTVRVENPSWQQISEICDLHTDADWETFGNLKLKGFIDHGSRAMSPTNLKIIYPWEQFTNLPKDQVTMEAINSGSITSKRGELSAELNIGDLSNGKMLRHKNFSDIFTGKTIDTIIPLFSILKSGRITIIDASANLIKEIEETADVTKALLPYAKKVITQFDSVIGGYEIIIAVDESSDEE